jgi:hypothetical protein
MPQFRCTLEKCTPATVPDCDELTEIAAAAIATGEAGALGSAWLKSTPGGGVGVTVTSRRPRSAGGGHPSAQTRTAWPSSGTDMNRLPPRQVVFTEAASPSD